jgi:hypothetical protein
MVWVSPLAYLLLLLLLPGCTAVLLLLGSLLDVGVLASKPSTAVGTVAGVGTVVVPKPLLLLLLLLHPVTAIAICLRHKLGVASDLLLLCKHLHILAAQVDA